MRRWSRSRIRRRGCSRSPPRPTGAAAQRAKHDYVVAVDRFRADGAWPTAEALLAAGSFDQHFAHMRAFWNAQLSGIAQVHVPDQRLNDSYRSGYIYTQIARSGNDLDTGVNNYQVEFSHDVIGILANLFTQGDFDDARALLLEARECRRFTSAVRRRRVDLLVAVGDLPVEDRRSRLRQGELRDARARGAATAEHRADRTSDRVRPDRVRTESSA